jgi:hypothetical protein
MMDLFPLASGVWWDSAKPVIQAPIAGQPLKTFKGFVTEEEITILVKHVGIPRRVSLHFIVNVLRLILAPGL